MRRRKLGQLGHFESAVQMKGDGLYLHEAGSETSRSH